MCSRFRPHAADFFNSLLKDEPAGTLLLLDELKLSTPSGKKLAESLARRRSDSQKRSKDSKRLRERLLDILWLGLRFLWSLVLQERLVQP